MIFCHSVCHAWTAFFNVVNFSEIVQFEQCPSMHCEIVVVVLGLWLVASSTNYYIVSINFKVLNFHHFVRNHYTNLYATHHKK